MTTRFPSNPTQSGSRSRSGAVAPNHPVNRTASVVPFRSRNAVAVAEQFAAELAERGTRVINCDDCVLFGTGACNECVVTFLLSLHDAKTEKQLARQCDSRRVEIAAEECQTLELLQASGLAPQSQFAVRPIALGARRSRV